MIGGAASVVSSDNGSSLVDDGRSKRVVAGASLVDVSVVDEVVVDEALAEQAAQPIAIAMAPAAVITLKYPRREYDFTETTLDM